MLTMFKVKNHEEIAEYTVLGSPEGQKARKSTSAAEMEFRQTLPSSKEEENDTTDLPANETSRYQPFDLWTDPQLAAPGNSGEGVFPGSRDGTGNTGALQIDEQPFPIGTERRSGPLFGSEVTLEAVLFSMELNVVFRQQLQSSILRKRERSLRILVGSVVIVFAQHQTTLRTDT